MRMIWMKPLSPLRARPAPGRQKRPLVVGSAVLAALFACTAAGLAADSAGMPGVWQITRDQDARQCRISLNAERTEQGDFIAGIPPACRHAMPVLAKAASWSMTDTTHLSFTGSGGESVLDFTRDGNAFVAQSTDGATYKLVLIHPANRTAIGIGIDPAAETAQAGKPAVIQLAPSSPPLPPKLAGIALPVPTTAEMAGRYSILRDKKRDTGCMLTLDDGTRVKGGDRAALAPACRDQGIVVFDPVAWQIVRGRLVLTAKAGHVTHLDLQPDGSWLKDPAEGKSLSLKKF
jgi:hypothetical protein